MPGMIRLLTILLAATPSPPPDATTTQRGLVNTKAQAFSGLKTFDGGIWTPTVNGVPVETTAAVTVYISPTGSDSALCTLAAPCATVNRALAQLPKRLSHNATIEAAAGTYTFTSSQLIDGITMAEGVTLTIQGSTAWAQWTPASGTASGTLTGFSALAFPTRAIFTDAAQAWPAASLWSAAALGIRGRFVCMTSGLQSGNKFPIHAASPTTLEVGRTSFTGGNPATGDTYEICTPSTVFVGSITGLLKVGSGTGTINVADLAVEPSAPNIQGVTLGGATGGRQGGYVVNFNRVRARSFPTGGGTGLTLTSNGNYGVGITDSAIIASTGLEGGNDSTAVVVGSNQNALGASRFSFTNVYVRGTRSAITGAHSIITVNGLTVDSENITSNVVVSLNKVEVTSLVNGWVNCYSGEGSSQSGQSGLAMIGGGRVSVFSLQVKGCQIGVDLGNFGGATQTPQAAGAVFAFSGTTARLDLVNIGQSSPTTGAGVMLGGSAIANLKGGTFSLSTVANGARDVVCPDLTTSFTEAAVQAAGGKFVECQGASVQR